MTNLNDDFLDNDALDQLIDSVLAGDDPVDESGPSVEKLSEEDSVLLDVATKVIQIQERYPGTPSPSMQQRMELKMLLRGQNREAESGRSPSRRSLWSNTRFQTGMAFAGIILLAFLGIISNRLIAEGGLPAAAGGQTTTLPLIIVGIAAIFILIYFIFRKR